MIRSEWDFAEIEDDRVPADDECDSAPDEHLPHAPNGRGNCRFCGRETRP